MASSEFQIDGMTCGGCEKSVLRCIEGVAHVAAVQVDRHQHKATVTWCDAATQEDRQSSVTMICAEVAAAGFECRPLG